MNYPASFPTAIAAAFYDKELILCSKTSIKDDRGWTRDSVTETETTYLVHTRYNKLAEVQEQYGIREDINIAITGPSDMVVVKGDIIKIGGKYYRIIDGYPNDTHKVLVGQVWSSKSSTSPSV